MRLKVISCEVLYRELCAAAARSVNQVDLEFLPKGLHDLGASNMRGSIQQAVDRVDDARYDAIVLGYALCGNGLAGLQARSLPLIAARAHDCITLFLGSRERYRDYFHAHPGVYFHTTGWIERGDVYAPQMSLAHEDLVRRFGEDNAQYIRDELTKYYHQVTFIEMGVGPEDLEKRSRDHAAGRGWSFEKVQGDMRLIQRLVDGPWSESEFLVVPPGSRLVARYDDSIIAAEPCRLS